MNIPLEGTLSREELAQQFATINNYGELEKKKLLYVAKRFFYNPNASAQELLPPKKQCQDTVTRQLSENPQELLQYYDVVKVHVVSYINNYYSQPYQKYCPPINETFEYPRTKQVEVMLAQKGYTIFETMLAVYVAKKILENPSVSVDKLIPKKSWWPFSKKPVLSFEQQYFSAHTQELTKYYSIVRYQILPYIK